MKVKCLFLLQAIESCITALGFSVGEIAALVFAGSFSFEEGMAVKSEIPLPLHKDSQLYESCNSVVNTEKQNLSSFCIT